MHRACRLACLPLLLLALLTLAACSRIELLYRNLDWLAARKLGDYVSLDSKQKDWLDERLDAQLAWHCRSELPRYLAWLERQRPHLDESPPPALLATLLDESRALLQPTFEHLAPDAAQLLAWLSTTQIDELQRNLAKERRKLHQLHLGDSAEQARVARAEQRLEGWLGPLHPQQRAYLRLWAARQAPNVRPWLAYRDRWQTNLLAELRSERSTEAHIARIEPLLRNPERYWDAEYRQAVERARHSLAELLSELWASATPAQREHFARRLDALDANLRAVPCAD